MTKAFFQKVPLAVTSIYVNGNGLHGYLQASTVQTSQMYANLMQFWARPCSLIHAVQMCNFCQLQK